MEHQIANTSFSLRKLRSDSDGVLAVIGIAMLPITVAAIWMSLLVARAAVERSASQVSADVTAEVAAMTLAAGMNILALINTVMAFLLVVIVALRMLEILSLAAAALFFALSFLPVPGAASFSTIASQSASLAQRTFVQEGKVAQKIVKALNVGTSVERAVAQAFPYLSMLQSLFVPKGQANGVALNFGIIPVGVDQLAAKTPFISFPARMGIVAGEGAKAGGKLAALVKSNASDFFGSLPVEEEGFTQICGRAAGDVSNLPLIKDVPFADQMGDVLGFIGGNAPELLCVPLTETAATLASKLADKSAEALDNRSREEAKKKCDADPAENTEAKRQSCTERRKDEFKNSPEGKKFEDDEKKQQTSQLAELQKSVSIEGVKTAKLWSMVGDDAATYSQKNEPGEVEPGEEPLPYASLQPNLFLNTYAFVETTTPKENNSDQAVIDRLTKVSADTAQFPGFQVDQGSARARFFFSCDESDLLGRANEADGIHKCADNALWRPGGWHALVGAEHTIGEDAEANATQALSGYVSFLTGGVLQKALGFAASKTPTPAVTTGSANTWIQRLTGSFQRQNAGGSRESHFADWFVAGFVGDTAAKLAEGEELEPPGPYFH